MYVLRDEATQLFANIDISCRYTLGGLADATFFEAHEVPPIAFSGKCAAAGLRLQKVHPTLGLLIGLAAKQATKPEFFVTHQGVSVRVHYTAGLCWYGCVSDAGKTLVSIGDGPSKIPLETAVDLVKLPSCLLVSPYKYIGGLREDLIFA